MKPNDKKPGKDKPKKPLCSVLITCGEPSEDGQMDVKMTYEGDATLASYLLQGAQSMMDEQEDPDSHNISLLKG